MNENLNLNNFFITEESSRKSLVEEDQIFEFNALVNNWLIERYNIERRERLKILKKEREAAKKLEAEGVSTRPANGTTPDSFFERRDKNRPTSISICPTTRLTALLGARALKG